MLASNSLIGLTQVIAHGREGKHGAGEELYRMALGEMRQIARKQLHLIPKGAVIEVTALVNEAWIKMEKGGHSSFENRAHFFAIAGRAIRDCAVEEARRALSLKAGGAHRRVNLDEGLPEPTQSPAEFLDLEHALERLGEVDASAAELMEQWAFVGLSHEEIAQARDVSLSTVRRQWRFARAFLAKQLEEADLDPR